MLSGTFCLSVRDLRCKRLGIGVGIDSGLVTHWQTALGVGEPTKARYMCVIGITSDDCHTWHRHV